VSRHLCPEQLQLLLEGPSQGDSRVHQHLSRCARCQLALSREAALTLELLEAARLLGTDDADASWEELSGIRARPRAAPASWLRRARTAAGGAMLVACCVLVCSLQLRSGGYSVQGASSSSVHSCYLMQPWCR